MEKTRFDIKQFDLWNERNVKANYLYLELADTYVLYAAKYTSEVPKGDNPDDHSLGWEETAKNFRVKIKRESFLSLDLYFWAKHSVWIIEMEALGYATPIKIYFQIGKDAKEMYDYIDEYIFGGVIKNNL